MYNEVSIGRYYRKKNGFMLRIEDLEVRYNKVIAIHEVSVDVNEGEVVVIIGANGAGKTTLLNTISGVVRLTKGKIEFLNEDITKMPIDAIVRRGLIQVPERSGLLLRMSVYENLEMGAYIRKDSKIRDDIAEIFERFPQLGQRKDKMAVTLSGGERQLLAIARGLMAKPKLFMLDELSLGLAPKVVSEIFRIIRELRNQGITILLVEQNAKQGLQCADRGYVMETGRIVMKASAQELLKDKGIQKAYIGEDYGVKYDTRNKNLNSVTSI